MDTQQALNALVMFGDRCAAGGLFKSIGDVLLYKQAVDQVTAVINSQSQQIGKLIADRRPEGEVIGSLTTN